ncbi:hypothetical protein BQ8794_60125 [Mesorhizobium prunaredense]|uniref:Uncharacterized protein n=1 Tax=Mesorhizobium prunaredense TaxID=1631249 RepID=A0A1R3VG28_9HYPH|nr:hypothetical protein BQ8794_60125 [Mesorhizobium prunaredense]
MYGFSDAYESRFKPGPIADDCSLVGRFWQALIARFAMLAKPADFFGSGLFQCSVL